MSARSKKNFEDISDQLKKQETEGKCLKIRGLKKVYPNGFTAVDGLSTTMYDGQIYALLGHNGAGKSTTISMLTGLIDNSDGLAEVFGLNVFDDMAALRQIMGVCPQHDVLFPKLTPTEHLDIFARFKGATGNFKELVDKMVVDIDLDRETMTLAGDLSGGNKRKLSIGIALIGGSKVVLLDEPTSGMDLTARRKLWNMLKENKNDRIVLLTTHFMDEADILGDRIGIMVQGKMICNGSPLFLKNRFGIGYNLTVVKEDNQPNPSIAEFVTTKLPGAKALTEVSSEASFRLPLDASPMFKQFFEEFDAALSSLNIRSYGISVTTLEEVFLRVGHGGNIDDDVEVKRAADAAAGLQRQVTKKDDLDDYSITEDYERGCCNVFCIHFKAVFSKRFLVSFRNWRTLLSEILVVVGLCIFGFGVAKIQFFFDSPQRTLQYSLFPSTQRILYNSDTSNLGTFDTTPAMVIDRLGTAYFTPSAQTAN